VSVSEIVGLALLPAAGALIGWVTNSLAIWLLFRPLRPLRLPCGIVIWGVVPRRQAALARGVAEVVATRLFTARDIKSLLGGEELAQALGEGVHRAVHGELGHRLPPWFPAVARRRLGDWLSAYLERRADGYLDAVAARLGDDLGAQLRIARVVEAKVLALDPAELEGLARSVAGRELRVIIWLGGVIGFFIGLVQAGLFELLQ